MIAIAFTVGVAWAGDEQTRCFPLTSDLTMATQDLLITEQVFLEEWSICGGLGKGGPQDPPPLLRTGADTEEVLRAVVARYNAGSDLGLDYEVVRRGDRWLVSPIGVHRVLDTTVSLGGGAEETVDTQTTAVLAQVIKATHLSFGFPWPDPAYETPSHAKVTDVPAYEALSAVFVPLEQMISTSRDRSDPVRAPHSTVMCAALGVYDPSYAYATLTILPVRMSNPVVDPYRP